MNCRDKGQNCRLCLFRNRTGYPHGQSIGPQRRWCRRGLRSVNKSPSGCLRSCVHDEIGSVDQLMNVPTARWMIRSAAEASVGGSRARHLLSMQPEISRRRVIDPVRVLELLLSCTEAAATRGIRSASTPPTRTPLHLRVSVAVSFHRLIRYQERR